MQGFIIPELIIESIIRDGIENCKNDPEIVNMLFSQLTRSYAAKKYGQKEIDKIQEILEKKEIAVVYSYHEVDQKPYTISIMVGSDMEDARRDHIDDAYEQVSEQITDPDEMEDLYTVQDLEITSYDPISGLVRVPDTVDLFNVYRGFILTDIDDQQFEIINAVSNVPGDKFFFIAKGSELNTATGGSIRTMIDFREYEVKGITSNVKMVLGVHTKDALTTKWLYVLLKYWIVSRKKDMIKRGLYLPMVDGSDFNRDGDLIGDKVYTRFLTVNGKVDDVWRSDQVQLIDHIEINAIPGDIKQTS